MLIATEDNSYDTYLELCRVLGIDPKAVNKVTIELEAGKLFTVTVKRWFLKDTMESFVEEVKKYNLKEANE